MDEIWIFKNVAFYDGREPEEFTIQGENFRELMDLCFACADRFSLRRCNWPEASDGALEQALRPFCLGEYRSYAAICTSEDEEIWENCYLYPATNETKAILLQFIPHLFGREPSLAPEGHEEYLQQKYAAYYQAAEAASNRPLDFLENYYREHPGSNDDDAAFIAFWGEAHREANAIWRQIFDARDYYSNMEDPCFFHGNEMFFETITHEGECCAHIFSDAFGAKLRELGEWVSLPNPRLPLFSLRRAKKLVWYEGK